MTMMNGIGLVAGLTIGIGFAGLQWLAQANNERRNERRWLRALLPGSASRVAVLLLALVGVQFALPAGNLWWITFGALLAQGVPLGLRLRRSRQPAA